MEHTDIIDVNWFSLLFLAVALLMAIAIVWLLVRWIKTITRRVAKLEESFKSQNDDEQHQ